MNEAELEDLLSKPRDQTVAALAACPGDIVVLGAGGKMGPSLSRMARRAADAAGGATCRVIAVSRWSSEEAQRALNDVGVETIRCDLLDRSAVGALPDAPNVIFMAGQKFGTTGAPEMTWGMNTLVPAICAERNRVASAGGIPRPLEFAPFARWRDGCGWLRRGSARTCCDRHCDDHGPPPLTIPLWYAHVQDG